MKLFPSLLFLSFAVLYVRAQSCTNLGGYCQKPSQCCNKNAVCEQRQHPLTIERQTTCCLALEESCKNNGDCCNLHCSSEKPNSPSKCCEGYGSNCLSDEQCCSGKCRSNKCEAFSCSEEGEECQTYKKECCVKIQANATLKCSADSSEKKGTCVYRAFNYQVTPPRVIG